MWLDMDPDTGAMVGGRKCPPFPAGEVFVVWCETGYLNTNVTSINHLGIYASRESALARLDDVAESFGHILGEEGWFGIAAPDQLGRGERNRVYSITQREVQP